MAVSHTCEDFWNFFLQLCVGIDVCNKKSLNHLFLTCRISGDFCRFSGEMAVTELWMEIGPPFFIIISDYAPAICSVAIPNYMTLRKSYKPPEILQNLRKSYTKLFVSPRRSIWCAACLYSKKKIFVQNLRKTYENFRKSYKISKNPTPSCSSRQDGQFDVPHA